MSDTKQSLIILENDCLIPNTTQTVLVSSLFESSLKTLTIQKSWLFLH